MNSQSVAHRIQFNIMSRSTAKTNMNNQITKSVLENGSSVSEDTPAWLTTQYMEKCLQTYYKDPKLHIQSMDARPALGKGENYCSVMTRIRLNFTTGAGCTKTGHYIVKSSYEADEFSRNLLEPFDITRKELDIYEKVIPKLNALLQEIGDTDQLFAETFAVDYENLALIFEDLSVQDFTTSDRFVGMDMDLTKLVLKKMAKFHATTAVVNERENGCLEGYDRGMFNKYTNNYDDCFVGLMDACSRRLKQSKELKYYGEKLDKLRPFFMQNTIRACEPVQGYVNVLAHGDFWTNNVMIKLCKETGTILDLIMIDFQYSAWATPAVDLHYLLSSSLQEELQCEMQDELVQYYYYIFADTLRKLAFKSKIPTLREFQLQVKEKAFIALTNTICNGAVQRNEETEEADLHALVKTDERAQRFKDACHRNPKTQRIINRMLPKFDSWGLLEINQ